MRANVLLFQLIFICLIANGQKDIPVVKATTLGTITYPNEGRYSPSPIFSDNGKYLAYFVINSSPRINIISISENRIAKSVGISKGNIDCMAFSPDGRWFAFTTRNKFIVVLDLSADQAMERNVYFDTVTEKRHNFKQFLCFSPDGNYLAAYENAGYDKIQIWETNTWNSIGTITGKKYNSTTLDSLHGSIVFSADNNYVITSGDKWVKRWSLSQKAIIDSTYTERFPNITISPNGSYLVTLSNDYERYSLGFYEINQKRFFSWGNTSTFYRGFSKDFNWKGINLTSFSEDSKYLLSADRMESIQIIRMEDRKTICRVEGPFLKNTQITGIKFLPGSEKIIVASNNNAKIISLPRALYEQKAATNSSPQQPIAQKPGIIWNNPVVDTSTATKNSISISVCLSSKAAIKHVLLYINNKPVIARGIVIGDDSTISCQQKLNETISLMPGYNNIKIEASNEAGVTISNRVILLTAPASPVQHQSQQIVGYKEKRKALVIGNSKYIKEAELPNTLNDADSMSNALTALGFEVTIIKNCTKRDLTIAINTFSDQLAGYEAALLFYSGHGIENYLVPVDADIHDRNDLEQCFEINRLIGKIADKVKVSMFFFDACRNNPWAKSLNIGTRNSEVTRGIDINRNADGSVIAYSTALGTKAKDFVMINGKKSANSPYTLALLQNIRTPGLSIYDMLAKVKGSLKKIDDTQSPKFEGDLSEQYYLNPYHQGY